MKRREFLKRSVTVSALAGLGATGLTGCKSAHSNVAASAGAAGGGNREYYELRVYRLKNGGNCGLLDAYLEKAAIPAWNRLGIKTVGVFTEKEVKEAPARFVLLPYPSLEVFASASVRLGEDKEWQQAGAEYLQSPKSNPAFDRIDSWLMLAFAGMPRLELPPYCREKKPRMFELRTYESHSELKALKKIQMFNSGEIGAMHEVGLAPVFYGQALTGPNLPHLTYMTSAENEEAHKKHWAAFGKHPVWQGLQKDPQYADTVSKATKWFLVPTAYSQI